MGIKLHGCCASPAALQIDSCLLCCLQMSAQAVARIMHGVPSVAYPAAEWRKCGYWGRYKDVDFAKVLKVAEEQLE